MIMLHAHKVCTRNPLSEHYQLAKLQTIELDNKVTDGYYKTLSKLLNYYYDDDAD